MHNNCHLNLFCGISYRHPNGDLEWFIEYLSSVADKINQENKTCIIMGNFNLELLKLESHSATEWVSFILWVVTFSSPIIAANKNHGSFRQQLLLIIHFSIQLST